MLHKRQKERPSLEKSIPRLENVNRKNKTKQNRPTGIHKIQPQDTGLSSFDGGQETKHWQKIKNKNKTEKEIARAVQNSAPLRQFMFMDNFLWVTMGMEVQMAERDWVEVGITNKNTSEAYNPLDNSK